MKPDEIHLTDLHRLLLGQAPWAFLLEVIVRAIAVYVLLLITTRMMGKRVAGQMSVMELTIVVTLGAAIGVPLQAPDRGLLPAVLILAIAVFYQRGFNLWAFKDRKAEVILQGDVSILVRDGMLDLNEMRRTVLSRERLFSVLRQKGLIHLGQAKRVYLEADGHISTYINPDPPPGLCLMPEQDVELYEEQFAEKDQKACRSCGHVVTDKDAEQQCSICGARKWAAAVQNAELNEMKTLDQLKSERKTRDHAQKERETSDSHRSDG